MSCFFRPLPLLPRIIGALLLVLLGGCSAIQFGYNNAATLSYWWLDSYVDFTDAQTLRVREELGALHAWHRRQELPAYTALLGQMQELAAGPVTPDQICALVPPLRLRLQRLGEQAAEGMSTIVPTLQPEQLRQLALQFDRNNQKWRAEWLDGTPEQRQARRLKQAIERAEMFYGRLEEQQLALLRQSMARSIFDARQTWRERLRRQQDMLQALQEHSRGGSRPAHVEGEMLALIGRSLDSPDAAYRQYLAALIGENCRTIAALHNSASAAQRLKARETLRDYEADLRTLSAAP